MLHYKAYGLVIASEIPIGEFIPENPRIPVHIIIRRGNMALPRRSLRLKSQKILPLPGGELLYWKNIGAFLVEGGNRVTVMSFPDAEKTGLVNSIIVGAVMGVLLFQRMEHALFHSAVLGRGDGFGAVALLARSGGGKSTLAADLLRRGYSLVSDDILVLERETRPLTVQPGYPGMKLWKESVGSLAEHVEDLPMIGKKGEYEKRSLSLQENFIDNSLPLGCIFILEYGRVKEPVMKRLTPGESLGKLLPHWYGSLFRGDLIPILGRERLFRDCALLAGGGSIYTLTRPVGMAYLERTADLIDGVRQGRGERK